MKVKQLIESLEQLDPEAPVLLCDAVYGASVLDGIEIVRCAPEIDNPIRYSVGLDGEDVGEFVNAVVLYITRDSV